MASVFSYHERMFDMVGTNILPQHSLLSSINFYRVSVSFEGSIVVVDFPTRQANAILTYTYVTNYGLKSFCKVHSYFYASFFSLNIYITAL